MTLKVIATGTRALGEGALKWMWEEFMKHGTSHSAEARTLPYIMNKCEDEGVPYRLTAMPGKGYRIDPIREEE